MSEPANFSNSRCPACGHNVAVRFMEPDQQPLATLGWPDSAERARGMQTLPLRFVRCVRCGHVYNAAFDYAHVPYSDKPNLMFNRGLDWSGFIADTGAAILDLLPGEPVVVEIGHGDGSFLESLHRRRPQGRFVGFDPHGAVVESTGIELRPALFDPGVHLRELAPDILLSRHVLEHLNNPLAFLQSISFAATLENQRPLAYLEVPCIDRVLETLRTCDFYYEHSSQFTTRSFSTMLEASGAEVLRVGHGYDGEVVYGFVRLGGHGAERELAAASRAFAEATAGARHDIATQLSALLASGRSVAVWGGTGKSAAFLCRHGMTAERFPVVVDSDPAKVGTYVPGTGQEIRFRDYLLEYPADILIIPPQWRAADILAEMREVGITADSVLIEHGGRLIDYFRDAHCYPLP